MNQPNSTIAKQTPLAGSSSLSQQTQHYPVLGPPILQQETLNSIQVFDPDQENCHHSRSITHKKSSRYHSSGFDIFESKFVKKFLDSIVYSFSSTNIKDPSRPPKKPRRYSWLFGNLANGRTQPTYPNQSNFAGTSSSFGKRPRHQQSQTVNPNSYHSTFSNHPYHHHYHYYYYYNNDNSNPYNSIMYNSNNNTTFYPQWIPGAFSDPQFQSRFNGPQFDSPILGSQIYQSLPQSQAHYNAFPGAVASTADATYATATAVVPGSAINSAPYHQHHIHQDQSYQHNHSNLQQSNNPTHGKSRQKLPMDTRAYGNYHHHPVMTGSGTVGYTSTNNAMHGRTAHPTELGAAPQPYESQNQHQNHNQHRQYQAQQLHQPHHHQDNGPLQSQQPAADVSKTLVKGSKCEDKKPSKKSNKKSGRHKSALSDHASSSKARPQLPDKLFQAHYPLPLPTPPIPINHSSRVSSSVNLSKLNPSDPSQKQGHSSHTSTDTINLSQAMPSGSKQKLSKQRRTSESASTQSSRPSSSSKYNSSLEIQHLATDLATCNIANPGTSTSATHSPVANLTQPPTPRSSSKSQKRRTINSYSSRQHLTNTSPDNNGANSNTASLTAALLPHNYFSLSALQPVVDQQSQDPYFGPRKKGVRFSQNLVETRIFESIASISSAGSCKVATRELSC